MKISKENWQKIKEKWNYFRKNFIYLNPVHTTISWLIYAYLQFTFLTSRKVYLYNRKEHLDFIQNNNTIVQISWHARMFSAIPCIPRILRKDFFVLASKHKDGQFASKTMKFMGFDGIAGSTIDPKKGASKNKGSLTAIRNMVRKLRKEKGACFTPDGPRGPRYKIQSNFLEVMKLAGGCPVIPAMYSTTRGFKLDTWDEFLFPLPFGTFYVWLGDPITVNKDDTSNQLKEKEKKLEKMLNEKMKELDRITGVKKLDKKKKRKKKENEAKK